MRVRNATHPGTPVAVGRGGRNEGEVLMKTGRLATRLEYPLAGLLALMGGWPAHAQPQDHQTSTVTSQHHDAAQKDQAGALVRLVRESTERFRDVRVAEAEEYHLLFGCVSGSDWGAMG